MKSSGGYGAMIGIHNPFDRKPAPKTLKSIEVSRSAKGGFLMEHRHHGMDHAPEMKTASTGAEMIAHLRHHMGITDADKN